MSVINDMYNNNNVLANVPRTQVPSGNRLQDIYNEVLAQKKGNAWANMIEDSLAPLGQIIANATIKNGFQQGAVANSLENERQRSIARRLAKQEQANREGENYIDLAREQLGLDTAEDERAYNRDIQAKEMERIANEYADKITQQRIDNQLNQEKQDEIKRHNQEMEKIARAGLDAGKGTTTDLSPQEKITLEANTKNQLQLQSDLNKILANKDAFEEKMKGIENLANEQGNVLSRAWETATMTGNKAKNSQSVKNQLIQATLDAYGIPDDARGDEKKVAQIVSQVGIGKGSLSKKDIQIVKDNIRRIYETRINQKNNELNRLLNPTSIGVANEDTGGL